MIEEPPYSQSRSRIHDQKIQSPRLTSSSFNSNKPKQNKSSELDIDNTEYEFIEKIDIKKFSSILLRNENDLNDDEAYNEYNKSNDNEKVKKIIQKFIRMKSFPMQQPQLITKLLRILQVVFRFYSGTIFNEKDTKNDNESNEKNAKDVKMIIGIQCPICEKLFRSSHFIDKHILKKHPQHNFFWQNLKSPIPLYNFQKPPSNDKSEEIEKMLKKIHKDLKNGKRNSSVSIETRISNIESTMHNAGLISKQISLPNPENAKIRHSRRHSSNSISIDPLQSDEKQNKKDTRNKRDSYDTKNAENNPRGQFYHHHNDNNRHNNNENNYNLNSARVNQTSSTPQIKVNEKQPNSARVNHSSSIQQSQSTKIPKLPSKPFIPNLHLQAIKPQQQQVQQPPSNDKSEEIVENEVEINVCTPPEARRRTPNSSRPNGMKRPLPRKKPNSINVPSIQLDFPNNDKNNMTQNISNGNYGSPDGGNFSFANSYRAPQSARANSHPEFTRVVNHSNKDESNNSTLNVQASTPKSRRVIPFPSSCPSNAKGPLTPTKNDMKNKNVFSPPFSPFVFIQSQSDDDDEDVSDEVHINTTSKIEQNEKKLEDKNSISQKIESSTQNSMNQKIESENKNSNISKTGSISVDISKKTKNYNDNIDDEISEEYFQSISSVSSESSELPEIDFKPKSKQQEAKESNDNSVEKRQHRKKIENNNT